MTLVTVNDSMQRNYRYELAAPAGRSFEPEFTPDLTPKEMLHLGIFCGKYMTDCRGEFPASWFAGAKLANGKRDCSLNFFGVDASQPLASGGARDGSIPTIRAAGSSGIAAIIWAGGCPTRMRVRSGGGRRSAVMPRKSARTASRATSSAGGVSVRPCCIGPMTAGKSDG